MLIGLEMHPGFLNLVFLKKTVNDGRRNLPG